MPDRSDQLSDGSLLELSNLKTYFFAEEGTSHAVDDVSLILNRGETICLVGESGCGKSVTALSIMGLIPNPPGKIVSGSIRLSGYGEITKLTDKEMLRIRGKEIAMIFQEPMTSLNPVFTIGNQISEGIRFHEGVTKKEAIDRTLELLKIVGIPAPEKRIRDYPHQLSGGMRQRVMIAMALACNPKLLIADEPTTALDVTIQAQIIDLMKDIKRKVGMAIVLITHNLGVVSEMAQRVYVMYAGVIVEQANVKSIFANPLHPYTYGLLTSIPRLDKDFAKKRRLNTIPGIVPSLLNLPEGCRFYTRCNRAFEDCQEKEPPLIQAPDGSQRGHFVRCWLYSSSQPKFR
jgi:oligopeptide/dipeptide ABC transporter ATP-binding protein